MITRFFIEFGTIFFMGGISPNRICLGENGSKAGCGEVMVADIKKYFRFFV